MSSTPIFDEALAAAPADIFLASPIFPHPPFARGGLIAGPPSIVDWVRKNLAVEVTPWQERIMAQVMDPRYKAKVIGVWSDPANLGVVS